MDYSVNCYLLHKLVESRKRKADTSTYPLTPSQEGKWQGVFCFLRPLSVVNMQQNFTAQIKYHFNRSMPANGGAGFGACVHQQSPTDAHL